MIEDCSLDRYFESVTLSDGRKLWFAKAKDGDGVIPVLFCPICGKTLYQEGKE